MGQREVLEFLEKEYEKDNKKYFSKNDICSALQVSTGCCTTSLQMLRKHKEVEFYRASPKIGFAAYFYRHKADTQR
jgi:hypothetical protein